ncbi:MAG: PAS domain-containing protein [Candidatus Tectimicrobiota bacterium]
MERVLEALAHAADGVYAVDHSQRIVFWNAAAERLLGYQPAEVLGQTCDQVLCGQALAGCLECRLACSIAVAAQQGQPIPAYNLLSRTKEGKTLLLNVSVIVAPASAPALATIHLFRAITPQPPASSSPGTSG